MPAVEKESWWDPDDQVYSESLGVQPQKDG